MQRKNENYEDLSAAEYQAKSMVRSMLRKYDANTVVMAFNKALSSNGLKEAIAQPEFAGVLVDYVGSYGDFDEYSWSVQAVVDKNYEISFVGYDESTGKIDSFRITRDDDFEAPSYVYEEVLDALLSGQYDDDIKAMAEQEIEAQYDQFDTELDNLAYMTEEKLDEASKMKSVLALVGILFGLGVQSVSAQSLKSAEDWNKSIKLCKQELMSEFPDQEVPEAEARKMVKACLENDKAEVLADHETVGSSLGKRWFMSPQQAADSVRYNLEQMGFKIVK